MADTTTPSRLAYEVEWEEPPPAPNSIASGGGELFKVLEAIQEKPGVWARVATCSSLTGANGIKTSISKGKRRVPDGQYEFTTRTNKADGTSKLYARYVGEGAPAE